MALHKAFLTPKSPEKLPSPWPGKWGRGACEPGVARASFPQQDHFWKPGLRLGPNLGGKIVSAASSTCGLWCLDAKKFGQCWRKSSAERGWQHTGGCAEPCRFVPLQQSPPTWKYASAELTAHWQWAGGRCNAPCLQGGGGMEEESVVGAAPLGWMCGVWLAAMARLYPTADRYLGLGVKWLGARVFMSFQKLVCFSCGLSLLPGLSCPPQNGHLRWYCLIS